MNMKNIRHRIFPFLTAAVILIGCKVSAAPQSGQFYKTKMYKGTITVADIRKDHGPARMVSTAFQGLINQDTAQCYLYLADHHVRQLNDTKRPFEVLPLEEGADPGLRSMFRAYADRVRNIYIWSPEEDWSWNMAVMLSAQHRGLPLTEELYARLTAETPWKGNVVRLYGRWASKRDAYEWAMKTIQPACHPNILFSLGLRSDWMGNPWTLYDYAVASRGFAFWLDDADPEERSIIEEICRKGDFKPGAIVMGYAKSGDDLLYVTNRYNIGYVVSDYYANGSFWCSYPNKSFKPRPGRAVKAENGKIYVSVVFSDGDNVQFDQNALYAIWTDDTDRGAFPVGTTLCAGMQELNPFLLEWYYDHMSPNDELMAGPSGYQFIYGRDYSEEGYEKWLELNRQWLASAGFKTACFWHTSYGTDRFYRYVETAGLEGVFNGDDDVILDYHDGVIIMNQGDHLVAEGDLYNNLAHRQAQLDPSRPHFLNVYPTAATYGYHGIARLKREAERLEKDFPGRFVFLMPKDNVATARKYYEAHPEHIPWKNKPQNK